MHLEKSCAARCTSIAPISPILLSFAAITLCMPSQRMLTQFFLYWRWYPEFLLANPKESRCRWPRSLRRGSAATRLLGLRIRILAGAWLSVSCECCVLPGRVLFVGGWSLVQRSPTECGVSVCDHEFAIMRPWPPGAVAQW